MNENFVYKCIQLNYFFIHKCEENLIGSRINAAYLIKLQNQILPDFQYESYENEYIAD